jgi:hypothetical protein
VRIIVSFGALLGGAFLGSVPAPPTGQEALASYYADVVLDTTGNQLHGTLRLVVPGTLLNIERQVRLDLTAAGRDSLGSRLTLTEIGVSRPADVSRDSATLTVRFHDRVPARDSVVLTMEFVTRFWGALQEALGYSAFWGDQPGRLWHPDLFGPDGQRVRFRDFDVTLTYPADHVVLTTGPEVENVALSGGRRRARFVAAAVEGFALMMAPGFELFAVPVGDATVVALVPPDDREAFRKAAQLTAKAVAWYRDVYGFFPAQQIGLIPGRRRFIGGFPLPRVFMVHRGFIDDNFLQWITAHELGHYYWGLHVFADGPDQLDWLTLANGIWADQLYLAQANGRSLTEQWRRRGNGDPFTDYFTALAANYDQTLGLTEVEFRPFRYDYNSYIRHSKAAIGLYLLANRMGVQTFLDVQREVLRDYARRPFGLEDFLVTLESRGVPYARDLITAWMRDGARVDFAVENVRSERSADGWVHRVVIRLTGSIPHDIEVELVMADATTLRRTLSADGYRTERDQTLEVRHRAALIDVRLDPDGTLPMWNGTHPRVRRTVLEALDRVDQAGLFLDLVPAYLGQTPVDDDMRYRLGRRLLATGRLRDAHDALRFSVDGTRPPCATRQRCRAALLLAEILITLDRTGEARELLTWLRDVVGSQRLESRWRQVETALAEQR